MFVTTKTKAKEVDQRATSIVFVTYVSNGSLVRDKGGRGESGKEKNKG